VDIWSAATGRRFRIFWTGGAAWLVPCPASRDSVLIMLRVMKDFITGSVMSTLHPF